MCAIIPCHKIPPVRSTWKQPKEQSSTVLALFSLNVCLNFREWLVLTESANRSNLPMKLLSKNFILENLLHQCSYQQGQRDTCLSGLLNASNAIYTSFSYQLWISGFIGLKGAPQLSLRHQHCSSVSSWAADSLPAISQQTLLPCLPDLDLPVTAAEKGVCPEPGFFEQTVEGNILQCSPPT